MQLESLLWELFAYSYLLDPALLRFLLRATAQSQFSRPHDLDRSLRFLFIYCVLINLGPIFRHVLPGSYRVADRGLLLDFIGRATTPSRPHMFVLDVSIFVLQATCLFIAYEFRERGDKGPDDLAFMEEEIPLSPNEATSTALLRDEESQNETMPINLNAPILHLRPSLSFRKILYPPESPSTSPSSGLPVPTTTPHEYTAANMATRRAQRAQRAERSGPLARLALNFQQRLEEETMRAQGLGAGQTVGPGIGQGMSGTNTGSGADASRPTQTMPGSMIG